MPKTVLIAALGDHPAVVTSAVTAFAAAGGKECYCLAWEFEMDLRLHVAALFQECGVLLKLIQIPREIMEKNRKSPPPFLEMALLEAERKNADVELPATLVALVGQSAAIARDAFGSRA